MTTIPTLKMKKQRHEEVKKLAQGFTENKLSGAGFQSRVHTDLLFIF